MAGRARVTGATGFVGEKLATSLADAGWDVRCMVRDRGRAEHLERKGFDLHQGHVLKPRTLRGAGRGVDVAYYLIHSMGRGGSGDFVERDRAAARAFVGMAGDEGVDQAVYLGGLGGEEGSKHLRSRRATAAELRERDLLPVSPSVRWGDGPSPRRRTSDPLLASKTGVKPGLNPRMAGFRAGTRAGYGVKAHA